MLKVNNIEVIYSDVILVLKGLSMVVPEGQIVALLGANGAGKSTTLKAISGLLKSEEGEVTDGEILFGGEKINGKAPEEIVRKGIFQVMEGRKVFEDLTTEENLRCGAHTRKDQKNVKGDYERVYTYFPRLKERRKGLAGYLSGGEQQMLAIGRALMARPKLMSSTSRRSGCRRCWSRRSSASSRTSMKRRRRRSSWSSRTPAWRFPSPATATSWNTARWCSTAKRRNSPTTRTSRSSTSA
jgi:ABC-type branched-chain amino acid transport systems, ATPase component